MENLLKYKPKPYAVMVGNNVEDVFIDGIDNVGLNMMDIAYILSQALAFFFYVTEADNAEQQRAVMEDIRENAVAFIEASKKALAAAKVNQH